MGLFKKRKDIKEKILPTLPQLPEMPAFPELPKFSEMKEMSALPAFTSSIPSLPPQLSSDMDLIRVPIKPMTEEIGERNYEEKEIAKLKEPIFVKIDRYRDAVMNLEMIKKKLNETSNLLEKIKETRTKEEEELDLWTQEINTIKEKIETIDKKLFKT